MRELTEHIEAAKEIVTFIDERRKDIKCDVKIVEKNNARYVAIVAHKEDSGISPTVYVDDLLEHGRSFEDIADFVIRHVDNVPAFNVKAYTDFNEIKKNLKVRLFSKNAYSEKHLHREVADLYECAYVELDDDCCGTIAVTPLHVEHWGVTADEVFEIAEKNTFDTGYEITGIGSVLAKAAMQEGMSEFEAKMMEMHIDSATCGTIVARCSDRFGAAILLDPRLKKDMAERFRDGCRIIPSSVHEVLILPAVAEEETDMPLLDMVKEVNSECLAAEDVLSNSIYTFENGELSLVAA